MNAMVTAQFGAISTKFAGKLPAENDLGAGIEASYGLMKYRGKVWTTSYKGEERALMRSDGTGPMNSIDVVIVKAPKVKSKIFYAKGYVDGSTEAPDCWSTNGAVPDAGAAHKQSTTCATCPQNVWGSRITEAGKKGKACQDSKRIAIVPADTQKENVDCLSNTLLGGPMLLRIPAATLEALGAYGDLMQKAGFPYQAVVTRVAFDINEAYPKFTFNPVRPLTDAEADAILEMVSSDQVERILAETAPPPALPAPVQAPAFIAPLPGQVVAPPVPVAPAPAVTPQVAAPPAQPQTNGFGAPVHTHTPAAVQPPATAALPAGFEADLDKLLA